MKKLEQILVPFKNVRYNIRIVIMIVLDYIVINRFYGFKFFLTNLLRSNIEQNLLPCNNVNYNIKK